MMKALGSSLGNDIIELVSNYSVYKYIMELL